MPAPWSRHLCVPMHQLRSRMAVGVILVHGRIVLTVPGVMQELA